ncbi:MAG: hypothetical protein FD127_3855, partial [Acidimicrobiaceae bacterium]
ATVDRTSVVDPAGNSQTADHVTTGLVDTSAPTASLTFNRPARLYRGGALAVTATFSEPITPGVPSLSSSGRTGGVTLTGVAMTQGADRSVWTWQTTLQLDDSQGPQSFTLTASDAAGNDLTEQPTGNTYLVATAGLAATLTYSKAGRFIITATFTEPVSPTAPGITVTGTTGGASVAAQPMTSTGDLTVWTWQTMLRQDDTQGVHLVTLGATGEAGNELSVQPLDSSFTVDTVPPGLASLSFSQSESYLRPGPLSVTADFTESLASGVTPALTFEPAANFTPAGPGPSRLSPSRFLFSTVVGGSTPQGGVPYSATLGRTTVVDRADNLLTADHLTSGTVDGNLPASLAVGAFASPADVTRGQVFEASVVVTNVGQTTADLTSTTLAFSGTGLAAVPDGANPTALAGGVSATFRYTVTVGTTASADARTARLTVLARDRVGGGDVSILQRMLTPQVTVHLPAALSAGAFTVPAAVSQGQAFSASVVLANTGQATALIASTTLAFGGTGVTAVPGGMNPPSLAGGVSATFRYTVTAAGSAAPGPRAAALTVVARDAISNADAGLAGLGLSPQVTVQRPAELELVSVDTPAVTVNRGQRGLGVAVRMRNPGEAAASLTAIALTFSAGGQDRAFDYAVTPAQGGVTLTGGTTAVLAFTVDVSPAASLGPVTLDARLEGCDANSGVVLSDGSASLGDAWTVKEPVEFSLGPLSSPERVSQGQTFGASVTLAIAAGQSVAVTSTSLLFAGGGLTATPEGSNPVTLAGGVTATFRYVVAVDAAAATGARTATLTVQA